MNDTGKEQKTVPVDEETTANNNVEESADVPVEAEPEDASPEARVATLEAELAEQHDRLLRPAMVGVAKEAPKPEEPVKSADTVA